jgi:type II secretory pathway pseudopilin PulG
MDKNVKISGASIIEIMITMLIVALLLMAMVAVFPRMAQHRKGIQEVDQAKMIAAEVLDALQTISEQGNGLCALPTNSPAVIPTALKDKYNPLRIGSTEYKVNLETTGVNPLELNCSTTSSSSPFNTAKVTVSWTKSGKSHKVTATGVVR